MSHWHGSTSSVELFKSKKKKNRKTYAAVDGCTSLVGFTIEQTSFIANKQKKKEEYVSLL